MAMVFTTEGEEKAFLTWVGGWWSCWEVRHEAGGGVDGEDMKEEEEKG